MTIIHVSRDEWWPFYDESPWSFHPEVDVPDDTLRRFRRAMKAVRKAQSEMHDLYEAQRGKS